MVARTEDEPTTSNLHIGALSAGDIVFVYNRSSRVRDRVVRFLNVNGQRILAAISRTEPLTLKIRFRRFSHVMLGMGSGLIIHADGKTVSMEIISDALHHSTSEASLYQVYRRSDISPEIAEKIVKAAFRYYNQKYRFSSYFVDPESKLSERKEDTTQYCSSLVSYAYRSAGVQLSTLPDNKVLPVHLYRICQSAPWQDITAEFIQKPPAPGSDELVGSIEIPGEGEMLFSEYLAHTDNLLLDAAKLHKQIKELEYTSNHRILHNEALLAQYCGLQFDIAKKIRRVPGALEDKFAARIVRVLQQLDALLDTSQLPSLEILVVGSIFNSVEEQPDIGMYAGLPAPTAIREMQVTREAIRIYTYLLLAEVGLASILAHYTPHEKFELFRSVKREYAESFFAAVQKVANIFPLMRPLVKMDSSG